MTTLYDFTVDDIQGEPVPLDRYRGKVLLVVNTASKCGFTPQYKGLESLYRKYRDRGLEVLGFPCNQFGAQEPGSEQEIATFCETNYDVTFPMFRKIDVNGELTHPLFAHLKKSAPGLFGSEKVKCNFTKFLVAPDGSVKRFAPLTKPADLAQEIEQALG